VDGSGDHSSDAPRFVTQCLSNASQLRYSDETWVRARVRVCACVRVRVRVRVRVCVWLGDVFLFGFVRAKNIQPATYSHSYL